MSLQTALMILIKRSQYIEIENRIMVFKLAPHGKNVYRSFGAIYLING